MVRQFTDADMEEVMGWFHSRKIEITPDYLPKTGFIAPGVAAGFIYRTDSNWCIFENFISSLETTKESREAALSMIIDYMIIEAKKLGFKHVYGFVTPKSMLRRGLERGFRHFDTCAMIIKDL
jgi:hypothetical protein